VFWRCGLAGAWRGRRRFTGGRRWGSDRVTIWPDRVWARTSERASNFTSSASRPIDRAADAAAPGPLADWPGGGTAHRPPKKVFLGPGRARGVSRAGFPDMGVILDLAVGEAPRPWRNAKRRKPTPGSSTIRPARIRPCGAKGDEAWSPPDSAHGGRGLDLTVAGQVSRGLTGGVSVQQGPGIWAQERSGCRAHAGRRRKPPRPPCGWRS